MFTKKNIEILMTLLILVHFNSSSNFYGYFDVFQNMLRGSDYIGVVFIPRPNNGQSSGVLILF